MDLLRGDAGPARRRITYAGGWEGATETDGSSAALPKFVVAFRLPSHFIAKETMDEESSISREAKNKESQVLIMRVVMVLVMGSFHSLPCEKCVHMVRICGLVTVIRR